MEKPRVVLVTGCAGFIGSNFVRTFKARYPGTTVVGIDNLSTGRRSLVHPELVFYKGSITNEKLLQRVFAKHKPEYVFHFAALPRVSFSVAFPRQSNEANIVGTLSLLEAARHHGVRRVIYSSSSSVYGTAKTFPTSERTSVPNPQSPYALQKFVGEEYCRLYSALYGLDTVSLRYFTVYGPWQYGDAAYATVISAWLESLYFPKQKKGFIEGNGMQSRDFCYIDNVVLANILAMECTKPLNGEAINISHGEKTTLREVRSAIEKETGRTLALEKRPPRKGDVRHTRADIRKARKLLGYRPQKTFLEGLRETVAWFESRKK